MKLSAFRQVMFVIYRLRKVVSSVLKIETVVRLTLLKIEDLISEYLTRLQGVMFQKTFFICP